jgi:hypothetical protein
MGARSFVPAVGSGLLPTDPTYHLPYEVSTLRSPMVSAAQERQDGTRTYLYLSHLLRRTASVGEPGGPR